MRKIMDFVNVTVTVLTGAYLILLTLAATQGLRGVPDGLVASWGYRFLFLLIGIALVGMNIRVLVKEWKTVGLKGNLRLSTEQGTTELSIPSLEMLLLRDLREEPDIVEPMVTLTPRDEGKPMLCEIELKLRRQDDVIKRIDGIKRKVRDIIDRLIPGGLTVEVLVEVKEFVVDSMRARHEPGPASGEFNGPVYTNASGSDGV